MRLEINNFAAGIISPRHFGQAKPEMYAKAIRDGLNVVCIPEGGILKRPGTEIIRAANATGGIIRLEEYIDSDGDRAILEFGVTGGAGYIQRHDADGEETPTTTGVPFTTATQLKEMHCINDDGKMFITHPDFTTGLKYIQEDDSDEIELVTPTFYPIDTESKVYKVSDTSDDAGINQIRTDNTGGDFQFFATDVGQYIVMVISGSYYYAEITAVQETEYDTDADTGYYYSTATLGTVTAESGATAFTSLADGSGTAITALGIAPFNPYSSFYPGTICFAGGRMYLSAFKDDKRRIYGSCIGDYYNFRLGPADNFGIDFTLTDMYGGEIKWLQGGRELLVGTDTGIITVTAQGGLGATAIPTVIRQSGEGCSRIRPQILGNTYVFPQNTLDGLRIFEYQKEADSYITPELTKGASHLYKDSDIKDIAILTHPFPMYIIVLEDGTIVCLTFDQTSQVLAQTRWVFEADVESVAVLKSSDGDSLWMALNDGSTVKLHTMKDFYFEGTEVDGTYLEGSTSVSNVSGSLTSVAGSSDCTVTLDDGSAFANDQWVMFTDVTCDDADFQTYIESTRFQLYGNVGDTYKLHDTDGNDIDMSGYSISSCTGTIRRVTQTVDFTSVGYSGSEVVEVIANGVSQGAVALSSGVRTITGWAYDFYAGYGYNSYIRLLPFAPGEYWKRLVNLGVNVYKTTGVKIGESVSGWTELDFNDEILATDEDTEDDLFTGVRRKSFTGGYSNDNPIYIGQDEAYPMTLLSLYLSVKFEGE